MKILSFLLLFVSFGVQGKVNYWHSCEYKDRQTELSALACNMYHEARGEGIAGKTAVGLVTINRSKVERFPDSIVDVVYQHRQFSWTKDGKSDRVYELKAWHDSLIIAMELLAVNQGDYPYRDITEGSLFYHTTSVNPNWASKDNEVVRIGDHIFYREDVKK